ncbi:DUF975 family protein [Hungatella effluvii]|uniref:DUF975 family protein n=1 Tax=Hungatella effluvii TaxID=1096246 RepID=UPI002A83944F|nr:DUF975 family protein [Hungatella effluvii]
MNRQELKFDAKNKMREAAVNPYVVTLIMGVILMVLSGVQFILDFWGNIIGTGSSVNTGEASTYIVSSLVFFVIYLVISTILQFGYSSYCLKVANRDGSMSYGDLFSSVRYLLKAVGLTLMISVFVLLWCILLVIPGIIAAYRYSQAIFIMVEDPNKGIMQCIRESKEMMAGHKMEYFILELSFFFWMLLGGVPCGLAYIYVYPYMTVTFANYYNQLKPVSVVYENADTIN